MLNKQTNTSLFQAAKDAVQNKRGSIYVKWVCIILFLVILVAFMISFITAVDTAEGHRAYAKHALDSFAEEHSIAIYDEVKQNQSNSGRRTWIYNEFMTKMVYGLDLKPAGTNKYVKYDANGNPLYYVGLGNYNIQMRRYGDNMVSMKLRYTLTVPVTFMGTNTVWVDIPMEIVTEFTPKF